MWFLVSLLVVSWFTAVITFGLKAYWIHGLLLIAIVLYVSSIIQRRAK